MANILNHPDFDPLWCKALLASNIAIVPENASAASDDWSNSIFLQTLFTDFAVRAYLYFRRPSTESSMPGAVESCVLVSLGSGLDGMRGRAHGGLSALLLDQTTGSAARLAVPAAEPPATASLSVDYQRPISTPAVVLCRAWITELVGRKIRVKGTIEDGRSGVYAAATALYIVARGSVL